MTNLKAYVVSDFNNNVLVANMTELEVIEALKDEVSKLKAQSVNLTKQKQKRKWIRELSRVISCQSRVII
jgi:hypothetical protein